MKKSLYVFLCSLLGMLVFLILHRLFVFFCLLVASANPGLLGGNITYLEAMALDFFTLIIVLLLGMWYGIALGLRWYEAVYEKGEHGGFVDHIVMAYWPSFQANYNLEDKVKSIARELKDDVLELEHLTKTIKPTVKQSPPIRRRVVRKKADKTLS